MSIQSLSRISVIVVALLAASIGVHAQAPQRVVFATDWLAQAEHGGFYQAVAEGTYAKYGLDVQIRMGGPQVNGLQLLAAGQLDVAMADYEGWASNVRPGGVLVFHDVFEDPAEGGQAPFEVWKRAVESGDFAPHSTTGSLRVLKRRPR